MGKFAKTKRILSDGTITDVRVNPDQVQYVEVKDGGSYITFENSHTVEDKGVNPLGVRSPDSMEEVVRQLNRPYRIDLTIRMIGLVVASAGVGLAIVFGS